MRPQAASSDKITSQMSLSERADHLEEHMMHELDQHHHQVGVQPSDRRQGRDGRRRRAAGQVSRQVFQHGPRPAAAADAGEADAAGLFQEPLRLDQPSAAERGARAQERPQREGRAGVPAARHRGGRLHPLRPRLLGRADDRALRRRGGQRAIRMHQALRFFPDESVGYGYPDMYRKYFGDDYQPEPYIVEEYKRARNSKHYMTARLICVNDVYAFDPNAKVDLDQFEDIIGRNFRQPKEGPRLDHSPSAHMWRTIMWPTRFL